MQKESNLRYIGPLIVKWRNISYLNGAKETTCRNILADIRKKYNCRYVTVDHVCEHFMITREQYFQCQPAAMEM